MDKENREEEALFGTNLELFVEEKIYRNTKLNPQSVIELEWPISSIQDQLLDEGNARLNLATFLSNLYEPEKAVSLMTQTLEKNAIDKSPRVSTKQQKLKIAV